MCRYKKKKGKKKERSTKTFLNSLARNARTFRKLSLSVRRISGAPYVINECFLQTKWGRAKGKYATIVVWKFLIQLFPVGQNQTNRTSICERKYIRKYVL